jgi:hypothetical protein
MNQPASSTAPRLRSLLDLSSGEVHWSRVKGKGPMFELRASDEPAARLRWIKRWGSLAEAEVAEGRWTFKRAGFLRPRVTVRREGSEVDAAVHEPGWSGNGTLTLAGGRTLRWVSTSFWGSHWEFRDPGDSPLVHFHVKSGLRVMGAAVTVHAAARRMPELPLLLTLGFYLIVLMVNDAAAGAAAGGAASAAGD